MSISFQKQTSFAYTVKGAGLEKNNFQKRRWYEIRLAYYANDDHNGEFS